MIIFKTHLLYLHLMPFFNDHNDHLDALFLMIIFKDSSLIFIFNPYL